MKCLTLDKHNNHSLVTVHMYNLHLVYINVTEYFLGTIAYNTIQAWYWIVMQTNKYTVISSVNTVYSSFHFRHGQYLILLLSGQGQAFVVGWHTLQITGFKWNATHCRNSHVLFLCPRTVQSWILGRYQAKTISPVLTSDTKSHV